MVKIETTPEIKKADNQGELKALLEKNLELQQKNLDLNEEILERVKYIKRYVFWKKLLNWIVWILIIITTIISIFYLPTLVRDLQNQVQSMTGGTVTPGLLGF